MSQKKEFYTFVIFKEDEKTNYALYRVGPFKNKNEMEHWCTELRQLAIDTHDDIFAYPESLIEPKVGKITPLAAKSCRDVIEAIWHDQHPEAF
ncbi:MAG: hypothetical protein RJA61_445 [Candidatus Parcubacteria bacterium]|jgi:hypothetical protein